MLVGSYEHILDKKWRLIIPAKLRKDLGKEFVGVIDEDCLRLYPLNEWEVIAQRLREKRQFEPNGASAQRIFAKDAFPCEVDSQYRLVLPRNICERVGIKRELVILGLITRVEIWDKKKWEDFVAREGTPEKVLKTRTELGI